ncbi:MAG: His-Xaa-Ser system radical SAM maturase HxsC [Acidobacteriota bacterium]
MKLAAHAKVLNLTQPVIGRVTTRPTEDRVCRRDEIFLSPNGQAPPELTGFAAWLLPNSEEGVREASVPAAWGVPELGYLADGDVVAIAPNGWTRVLYRRSSPHNTILMTEQCNSYCLMCSQPPKPVDDQNRITEHLRLVELIDADTAELGITGGEPTLFKDDFIRLLINIREKLPRTALHVLTNGRMFYYRRFAQRVASVGHPDLMLGIPLYSDVDFEHDYIVQAAGAFEETVLGLHHLARYDVPVEIRVVLHRQTIPRLVRLAEFIARNLPFAAHVALMGLEMFGFVHKNLEEVWIDPYDYRQTLREAVDTLVAGGMNVSIYNHQLCILPRELWRYARQSISDWKNVYLDECAPCGARSRCGGFFQSGVKRHSRHIRAIEM